MSFRTTSRPFIMSLLVFRAYTGEKLGHRLPPGRRFLRFRLENSYSYRDAESLCSGPQMESASRIRAFPPVSAPGHQPR